MLQPIFIKFPFLLVCPLILLSQCNSSEDIVYESTVESLKQYQTPDWYRDAKFGIYCHWNAQSSTLSKYSGWYARHMYKEGHGAYMDHLKNWGHPSEVGYKDIIMAWKADKFDAAHWISLFKDAVKHKRVLP